MTVVRSQAGALLLAFDPVEWYEADVDRGNGIELTKALDLGPTEVVSALAPPVEARPPHREGESRQPRLIGPDRARPAG